MSTPQEKQKFWNDMEKNIFDGLRMIRHASGNLAFAMPEEWEKNQRVFVRKVIETLEYVTMMENPNKENNHVLRSVRPTRNRNIRNRSG